MSKYLTTTLEEHKKKLKCFRSNERAQQQHNKNINSSSSLIHQRIYHQFVSTSFILYLNLICDIKWCDDLKKKQSVSSIGFFWEARKKNLSSKLVNQSPNQLIEFFFLDHIKSVYLKIKWVFHRKIRNSNQEMTFIITTHNRMMIIIYFFFNDDYYQNFHSSKIKFKKKKNMIMIINYMYHGWEKS